MEQHSPLTVLKGIGEKKAKQFEEAGIRDLEELIRYYPRAYETFDAPGRIEGCQEGDTVSVSGCLTGRLSVRYVGHYQILTGKIRTEEETVPVTWFNMPYLRTQMKNALRYVFRGLVKQKGTVKMLVQPRIYTPEDYAEKMDRLIPIYPLTAGLTENALIKAVSQALEEPGLRQDYLPDRIRLRYELASRDYALRKIHFPRNEHELSLARKRLVFDEFFLFLLAVRQMRGIREATEHSYTLKKTPLTDRLIGDLPYRLTDAQMRTWRQVENELTKRRVMARLIQGDVGSGKTIIAFLALLMVAAGGGQGAMMVPTEVLARQHADAWERLAREHDLPYQAVLLTGSLTAKEKRRAYEQIASGWASVIIGTHALIQEKVTYHALMLVITDEQHRFGVKQREAFAFKGELPHVLVMSATPIPRTLAVILYGDLDISVIDQLPASRLPVKNAVVDQRWRPKAYAFLEKEVRAGHQAYVICPMVSSSEGMDAENVLDYTEKLRASLPPDIHIESLHGRMKPGEKNEVMERFLHNEIQILVSTTVVEVGVNVPNATVMMVENAERFGLAQLHQLRGRVGRGKAQSYCILVQGSRDKPMSQRLNILKSSNDGFEIARKDLEMRGPGDLFGIRQSGELGFALGDVFQDASILQCAQEAVEDVLSEDSQKKGEEYRELNLKLLTYMEQGGKNLNI